MRRLLCGLCLLPAWASAVVHYRLQPDPATGSFSVSVRIDAPKAEETFHIPAWCPGLYTLQNYDRTIEAVKATSQDGSTLDVDPVDSHTWRVKGASTGAMTLTYKVLGNDAGLGMFGSSVREDVAYVSGPSAFMYADDRKTEPTDLEVKLPQGWDIATAMDTTPEGGYRAGNYDEMADCPIQMGRMVRRDFHVGDIPFTAVFVCHPGEEVLPKVAHEVEEMKRVAEPEVKMFGSAPFKRYTVIVHLTNAGFMGGLEHRASVVVCLPNSGDLGSKDLYAHEFFHAWNVKQIRPSVLGPFDYTQPVRTGNLWFAEGVTDYYAKLMTYRSGLVGKQWLFDQISEQIQTLQEGKNRKKYTVEDASRSAWEDGGFGLGDLDYYNKGLVAGFLLDAAVRGATDGKKSLDDVMRLMYSRHRLPNPGYEEDGILQVLNEVAGKDLTPLYMKMIRTTDELPFDELHVLGLEVAPPNKELDLPTFTLNGDRLESVRGEANSAGLKDGDEFVSYEGVGAKATLVHVRRGGVDQTVRVPLALRSFDHYRLILDPRATSQENKLLSAWLSRNAK